MTTNLFAPIILTLVLGLSSYGEGSDYNPNFGDIIVETGLTILKTPNAETSQETLSPNKVDTLISDPPEKVVSNYLNALKGIDLETAKTFVSREDDQIFTEIEDGELAYQMLTILETLSFNIISTEVNDSTATVKAKVKNIDMDPVIGNFISEFVSLSFSNLEEGINPDEETLKTKYKEIFSNALVANKDTTIETEVDIQLVKSKTGWVIVRSEELEDGITGGLLSIRKDLKSIFGAGNEEESSY
jgi:hypothetical protein